MIKRIQYVYAILLMYVLLQMSLNENKFFYREGGGSGAKQFFIYPLIA